MPSECRTCLKISNDVLDIFFDDLPKKIETISSVEILPDYGFSNMICDECVEKVHILHSFRDQIIKRKAALDGETKQIQLLKSHCRTCLLASENLRDLFRDGLPYKIEVISLVEISQDARLSSKICAECEKQVRDLYEFRNTIIQNNDIIGERLIVKMETDIDIEGIKQEVDTFHLNDFGKVNTGITDTKIYTYKCLYCKFRTPSYPSLQEHTRSHEGTSIVCEICGKLISSTQLSVHVKSHEIKKVSCPICGMTLKHDLTLRIHLKRHNKTELFECSECRKLYKTRRAYKMHLARHEGKIEKNFKCSLCESSFCSKIRLDVHFRRHTGERPYLCEVCNKGFSSTTALKTHIRQHTEEKPYTCRYCDAAFKQAVLVRRHVKSKHPDKVVEKDSK